MVEVEKQQSLSRKMYEDSPGRGGEVRDARLAKVLAQTISGSTTNIALRCYEGLDTVLN